MILKVYDFKQSCGNIINLKHIIDFNAFKGIPIVIRGTEKCIGECIGNKVLITKDGLYTECMIYQSSSVDISKMKYYANNWNARYVYDGIEDYDNISDMIYKGLKDRSRIYVDDFINVIYQDM